MLGKYVAFAIGVCGFALLIVPSGDNQFATESGQEREVMSVHVDPARQQSSNAWYSGDHTLQREMDGHFYANAYVSGTPIRMMVDTGASVIALTANDASAAGLYWDNSEVRHIGSGASGAVYGVPTNLAEVEIGGMVRHNVDAVIIPDGLEISLLGQSYLAQIGSVEINGSQMVMSGN
ncbi:MULTISPECIES: TIGR02281 family clan AA aspartic protease [Altererythrobacter]|uniref:Aspartyl protease family protein n=1 Tax=Altererythrobacter ishigakiensis TaxID=476157 RepID=A0A562UU54_9SPHN|nr:MULTISPECIES: TIGR02281 family clan AA aspartic protease [Altererythrobacter]MBO6610094.1 TIGR02281 family clan AA aspartic protease [Altererythrobacter sp.]MBO6642720.1 TIGR02281 family clan AA aspartic protease [Altererythrobacter sp.]MBO6708772.1 TIGR02281 family clan AA aspartic protease [Altererythrobacter sp.]TWJ09151.1 aspartyl protease family protein [Altererythrobacter ishigakiensis]